MKFVFPSTTLPTDIHERYELLHNYFCDQRATSYQESGKWVVEPFWPAKKEYFIDPLIEEGFNWWYPNLSFDKSHQQVRNMPGYQLSLHDSWTLYSWSKWLTHQQQIEEFPSEVIVLHVDYHNDLMSPRVGFYKDKFFDLLTGNLFDLKEPDSVKKAILSGAIGVGSFMTPFLHALPIIHIRHLCDGHLTQKHGHVNTLNRIHEKDTLLAPNQFRPAVTFQWSEQLEQSANHISYKITDQPDEWLKDLPNAPILLHIDMDYFNCRYDGDSDWHLNSKRYDPAPEIMSKKMKQLFNSLSSKGVDRHIRDITVALSPGFYPVEFWKEGIEQVSQYIQLMVK